MTESKTLGLYLHIPFCRSRCYYCGFYSIGGKLTNSFLDALAREMENKSKFVEDRICDTVYLGGGTPSVLSGNQLKSIMEALRRYFHIYENAEITMEMNPCDMTEAYLKNALTQGINRISVGVQANHDELLAKLGRRHTAAEAEKAVNRAFKTGFRNISIDLMCELPRQTVDDFEKTLKYAVHLPITHMSVYSLILEEGTRFYQMASRGILARPSENDSWRMYQLMCRILPHYGFERYEISSFARKGFRSVHNGKYWKLEDYLGLGPSACSRIGRERWENISDLRLYEERLASNEPAEERIFLSQKEEMEEFAFLGLRMKEGINGRKFYQRYGKEIVEVYGNVLEKLAKEKMIFLNNGNVQMTYKGAALGNYVFEQFLLD